MRHWLINSWLVLHNYNNNRLPLVCYKTLPTNNWQQAKDLLALVYQVVNWAYKQVKQASAPHKHH